MANTGSWPLSTHFPRNVLPYKTGFELKPPGRPFDIVIDDDNLGALLEAPKISEANLDATVYYSSQSITLSGTSFPNTDWFQRTSLLDGFYSEELAWGLKFSNPALNQALIQSRITLRDPELLIGNGH